MDIEELKQFTVFLKVESEHKVDYDREVVSMCCMIIMGIPCFVNDENKLIHLNAEALYSRYNKWKRIVRFVNEEVQIENTTGYRAPSEPKNGEPRHSIYHYLTT